MILCSDYNPNECPIECLFASNTERYMTEPLDEFFTKSKLYGTDACSLKTKTYYIKGKLADDIVSATNDPLDSVTEELKNCQNDIIKKILDAHGMNIEYVKQHKEEFKLEEMLQPSLNGHAEHYILSHNGNPIGEWNVCTVLDFDEFTIKGKVFYKIIF